jgi:putative transcriptional regulator
MTNDVRLLRFLAQDMTQAELGMRVGITRQTIAAIEQGRYSPSLEIAFRIADVFGKRVDEVFHWQSRKDEDDKAMTADSG